jgi:hypothetical protein
MTHFAVALPVLIRINPHPKPMESKTGGVRVCVIARAEINYTSDAL